MELDNTKASCFRVCKRKYYWQHVLGLQSNFGSSAIRYGVTWHGMMEGYYNYIKNNGWGNKEFAIAAAIEKGREKWDNESKTKIYIEDYRTFDACCNALLQYLSFYNKDEEFIKIVDTESKFQLPIIPENDEEEQLMEGLQYLTFTGRIDLQLEMNFSNWILDFKTTSQNISLQANRLNRSGQLLGYTYAAKRVLGFPTEGCLVSLAYVSDYKSNKSGEYGQTTIDFGRVPQIYNDRDLIDWRMCFIDTARSIVRHDKEDFWPVNFDSCYQYGPCVYTKLCERGKGVSPNEVEGYHTEFWNVLEED